MMFCDDAEKLQNLLNKIIESNDEEESRRKSNTLPFY